MQNFIAEADYKDQHKKKSSTKIFIQKPMPKILIFAKVKKQNKKT